MTSASGVPSLIRSPLKTVWRLTTRPSWRRPVWWTQVILVFAFVQLYDVLRNFAPARTRQAFSHADVVLDAENKLGVNIEQFLNEWLAGHRRIAIPVDWYYDSAHYVVTFTMLTFVYLRREAAYRRLRDSLLMINMVGLLGFWLFPLAPPRMLPGFTDTVLVFNTPWGKAISNSANQFAAMPSLHIGWAVWVAFCTLTITRNVWLRAIAVVYPFVTIAAVISTGNHYVLDVFAGAFCAAVGITVPSKVAAWRRSRALGSDELLDEAAFDEPQLALVAADETDIAGRNTPSTLLGDASRG